MRSVPRKDTTPELLVRRFLHRRGLRFRIHDRRLPGSPDIVLPRLRTVVLVHGCFWHRHKGCPKASTPKNRAEFWDKKFRRNIERDEVNERKLKELGWDVVTVWECFSCSEEDLAKVLTPLLKKHRKK